MPTPDPAVGRPHETWFYELVDMPTELERNAVLNGLSDFNASEVGPADHLGLAILVRDDLHQMVAGLLGYTAWRWLCIEKLWVSDTARGRGIATQLVARAEAEALARGCADAWLDTFNPDALRLYEKLGYERIGELSAFVGERSRVFLRKGLTSNLSSRLKPE